MLGNIFLYGGLIALAVMFPPLLAVYAILYGLLAPTKDTL